MPSTVYKGDLVEASFGHESGLHLVCCNTDNGYTALSWATSADGENTKITFTGGHANSPVAADVLNYPVGMLVGSQVTFSNLDTGGGFDVKDDYINTGRVFTIIEQGDATANNYIVVAPALKTSTGVTSAVGEILSIMSFKTPTFDPASAFNTAAKSSAERVLTDQFIGIVNTIALPETKVDLKRYHVVGLGRDVAVQVPGRFLNQGGSFEANLHNSRWLYYCLGHEVVDVSTTGTENKGHGSIEWKTSALVPGDTYLTLTATGTGSGNAKVDLGTSDVRDVAPGDYLVFKDTTAVDLSTHMETKGAAIWPDDGAESVLHQAQSQECRRIAGIEWGVASSVSVAKVWLDDPVQFSHAATVNVGFHAYLEDGANGSPHLDASTGQVTNPVKRLLFSRTTVPSFAMEVSIRRNDTDYGAADTENATLGTATDSKQLTRVFRGCKVKDFTLTADTDAALRLTTNFDAALCYTDTGRLESSGNAGDRYDTHRMFEELGADTATQLKSRKAMGLAKGTQKPFMFYNGTIKLAGATLGQVVSFNLKGSTGVQQFYTINGNTQVATETDQVPFSGSRNPSIAVEGKTEYELEMEIIVDDPLFYHRMRRAVRNFDEDITTKTDDDMIRLSFTKQGSHATREKIDIIMDDYFIIEAPLPIPEDKGPLRSTLKIMPKNIKVIAQDTLLHA